MNLLSLGAIVTAVLYAVLGVRWAVAGKRDLQMRFVLGVFLCLGWWALCDGFFYVAPTESAAWFWHHLSALGWCGFIPVAAYYLLVMSGANRVWSTLPLQLLYWTPAAAFTLRMALPGETAFAQELIPSTSGLGWTYVQHFDTVWPYLLFLILTAYLGGALVYLLIWKKTALVDGAKKLAAGFAVLDVLAVALGVVTIFVIPHATTYFPPMSFVATLIFLLGYWLELRNHDLLHIELTLSAGSVFESSLDALLITDQNYYILYSNQEAKCMLHQPTPEGQCLADSFAQKDCRLLRAFAQSEEIRFHGLDLTLHSGASLLCSVTKIKTRRQRHLLYIFSLHDVSPLKDAQEQLKKLAHYDELTGLPNRRRLGEVMDEWAARAKAGSDFALLFMDLDHFKRINDDYGHHAGDLALKAVADAIAACLPPQDVAVRLGGDEFIVLHDLSVGVPELQASRIQQAVEAVDCSLFAPGVSMGVSIGWCRYSEAGNVRLLYKLADERMYALKNLRHVTFDEAGEHAESVKCV